MKEHIETVHGFLDGIRSLECECDAIGTDPPELCDVCRALAALAKIEAEHARVEKALQVASDALFATEHALDELAAAPEPKEPAQPPLPTPEPSDTECWQALRSNRWHLSYNPRAFGWIVQAYDQVCGNLGKGLTPEDAIRAALLSRIPEDK